MQTLLLLPGLLCDATAWDYQSKHLSHIAHIIIPDLNHAKTPAEMVASALDQAPPTFSLAGHSMGGWVALEIMRHHSNRVNRLCLINTTAKLDSAEKKAARSDMIKLAEKNDYPALIELCLKRFIYNDKYYDRVKVMLERNKQAFINQQSAMLARSDCVEILKFIKCPTLVIHASDDKVFGDDDSKQLAENITGAKLKIIQNCGHMSIIEAATETTELMKGWLLSQHSYLM